MKLNRYLLDCFVQAIFTLKEHRLRTFMSIIGVAVGVAAVMTVSVVSESGRNYVFSELESFGLTTLWIFRAPDEQNNPFATSREGTGITNDDYEIIQKECCERAHKFSAVVYPSNWMVVMKAGNNFSNSSVEGVDIDYLAINNDELVGGRAFRDDDMLRRRPIAIIGAKVSENLFGPHASPVGKNIRMGVQNVQVVGVLKYKDRRFLDAIGATSGYDINNRVLIPYTYYQQILGTRDVHTLQAASDGLQYTDEAINEIITTLDRNNHGRFRYVGQSMKEWIATANNILRSISLIGVVAASVSLFVGGIGIMNIMSTSVVERTREIGLRKALGARRVDIQTQFLIESLFISGMGGLLGLLFGFLTMLILATWSGFDLTLSPLIVIIALVVSMLVGVISGFYPAYRAARLSPVEALRYE